MLQLPPGELAKLPQGTQNAISNMNAKVEANKDKADYNIKDATRKTVSFETIKAHALMMPLKKPFNMI